MNVRSLASKFHSIHIRSLSSKFHSIHIRMISAEFHDCRVGLSDYPCYLGKDLPGDQTNDTGDVVQGQHPQDDAQDFRR